MSLTSSLDSMGGGPTVGAAEVLPWRGEGLSGLGSAPSPPSKVGDEATERALAQVQPDEKKRYGNRQSRPLVAHNQNREKGGRGGHQIDCERNLPRAQALLPQAMWQMIPASRLQQRS